MSKRMRVWLAMITLLIVVPAVGTVHDYRGFVDPPPAEAAACGTAVSQTKYVLGWPFHDRMGKARMVVNWCWANQRINFVNARIEADTMNCALGWCSNIEIKDKGADWYYVDGQHKQAVAFGSVKFCQSIGPVNCAGSDKLAFSGWVKQGGWASASLSGGGGGGSW